MDTRPAVLFVCLGNICRSPLAEAAFRKAAEDAGLDAECDSAGTAAYHIGAAPDHRSIAAARQHGIDIGHYQGRQLCADDFKKFTHIFALDQNNLEDIRSAAPLHSSAQIQLLMDMVPGREGESVTDPYYGDETGFDETWRDVSSAAAALVNRLRR